MAKFKEANLRRLRSDITIYIKISELGDTYTFKFTKGRKIKQVVTAMRNVAKRFGYTPLELYNPRSLNLPHFLTDAEIQQYNEKVEELKQTLSDFAEKEAEKCND